MRLTPILLQYLAEHESTSANVVEDCVRRSADFRRWLAAQDPANTRRGSMRYKWKWGVIYDAACKRARDRGVDTGLVNLISLSGDASIAFGTLQHTLRAVSHAANLTEEQIDAILIEAVADTLKDYVEET